MVAYAHALARCARTIGISMTSGGMGKTELSTKDTQNKRCGARAWRAMPIAQSYSRRIIEIRYAACNWHACGGPWPRQERVIPGRGPTERVGTSGDGGV